jgi:hypothetical protein
MEDCIDGLLVGFRRGRGDLEGGLTS